MSEHGERPRGTATHSEGLGGGSLPLSSLWRWTLWLALVAGLIQTVPAEAARHFSNRLIFQSVDAVWMAPAIDLVIFAGAWLLVPLASRWWGRKAAMQAAFGVLLFLFVIGPLLIVPRLHVYAALLLGVGLAVQ